MLKSRKVKFRASKKEKENIEFRTFLKIHADEHELDQQFLRFLAREWFLQVGRLQTGKLY